MNDLLNTFFEERLPSPNGLDRSLLHHGWIQVTAYDAWVHRLSGDVITGHQMRIALAHGLVPRAYGVNTDSCRRAAEETRILELSESGEELYKAYLERVAS